MTIRVAMWSGPRNLSTAMMRSFGARKGCIVMDEPFYAAYLAANGLPHPMREEIIANQPTDPAACMAACLAPHEPDVTLSYQKHMAHHMLDGFPTDWIAKVTNAFLIRDPLLVAASYQAKRETPTVEDLGFIQQFAIFEREADRLGHAPPVVDAADINADPQRTLSALCRALGISFDEAMLSWPAGPRDADGVWAPVWYGAVNKSTGFSPAPASERGAVTDHAERLAEACMPAYTAMRAHCL